MRLAAKRDANEGAIIDALVAAGCLVQRLTQGDGVPDLLVWSPAVGLILLEVKDGARTKSTLREAQTRWHQVWAAAPVFVVSSVDDALARVRVGASPANTAATKKDSR